MTINHSNCDHESSRAARARCRRLKANPDALDIPVRKRGEGGGSGAPKAQTPRDRDKQCDVCGVERVSMFGTEPLSGRVLFVGDKCEYYLRRSLDAAPVAW